MTPTTDFNGDLYVFDHDSGEWIEQHHSHGGEG